MPGPQAPRAQINTWTMLVGNGAVVAIDPKTGQAKWKFQMYDVTDSGILTTAGDVLFTGGREGYFQALDARTGALLWKASSARKSTAVRSPTRSTADSTWRRSLGCRCAFLGYVTNLESTREGAWPLS